jgi:AraC family transcriptional regulator
MKFGEFSCTHHDGSAPLTLRMGCPPGESGVSLLRLRLQRGAYFGATAKQHMICIQISPYLRLDCRMADRRLQHETTTGGLAICPAGIDCSAETDHSFDLLVLAIKPEHLALAAAEQDALDAQLCERMSGRDPALAAIAHALAMENAKGYPNGPLYWSETANEFLGNVIAGHTSRPGKPIRGTLCPRVLHRIKQHVLDHLAEPIEVAELAGLAGRSAFHFSRVFARSVGMTPYRYVVHLRLQAAIARVRDGRMGLAEIAADTGFADQSHLSRWVRRVHGVSPSKLA